MTGDPAGGDRRSGPRVKPWSPPGSVAVVTGGGTGIGAACGVALAEAGWTVVLAGRRARAARAPCAAAHPGLALDGRRRRRHRRGVGRRALRRRRRARTAASTCSSTTRAAAAAPSSPTRSSSTSGARWSTRTSPARSSARREAFRIMRRPAAAGRPHHQQRVDLGPGAAPALARLHGDEARDHRPHEVDRARRAALRHRLRPDRHRQRGHRHDRRDERAACARPTDRSGPSRRWPSPTSPPPSCSWPACRSPPTSPSMTVMATAMPLVGRG